MKLIRYVETLSKAKLHALTHPKYPQQWSK